MAMFVGPNWIIFTNSSVQWVDHNEPSVKCELLPLSETKQLGSHLIIHLISV